MSSLHNFLFGIYPYICLSVFLMGSLARFDRDQYTWNSSGAAICFTAAFCFCFLDISSAS